MTDFTVDVYTADDDEVAYATFVDRKSNLDPVVGDLLPLGDPHGRHGAFDAVVRSVSPGAAPGAQRLELVVSATDREIVDHATVSGWKRHRPVSAVDPSEAAKEA